jgi:hypothetical protein
MRRPIDVNEWQNSKNENSVTNSNSPNHKRLTQKTVN